MGDNPGDGLAGGDVDSEDVARIVERYPVRCAVLYGSRVRGTATADSDVDVAVAFEEGLSPTERLERRIDLTGDLIDALGTDDVDVADLDTIRPEVGLSALRTGCVLLGTQDVIEDYRERFERETTIDEDTHEQRMRRFDSILEQLEGQV
jgi:predicted nucleotidyltransferase